ncbi:MAG: hypothetical protein J7J46_06190 [Candidatus Desulfofervidus sp.]|nr:hypothetical protein [Candidatus Desulfofervidus sp.]
MNLSDIFLNNGQLNWDAIGAISNIVLVTALVLITYWYAKKVSEQTDLMVKDRERNKILEEVQYVLTPTIHHLEKEIEYIQNNNILWSKRRGVGEFRPMYGRNEPIHRLFNTSSAVLKDVIYKYPELKSKFSSHDNFRDKLSELYAKIEKEVRTPEFEEQLRELLKRFNESKEGAKLDNSDSVERKIGYFIISKFNPERSTDSPEFLHDFWNEYRNDLLKFRDTTRIKEYDKEIEGTLSQLKELDEALLEKLETIREKYRVKYNLTKYEINPNEEW